MADIKKMVKREAFEVVTDFTDHSGNVYAFILESEDKGFEFWMVWAAGPTSSHFANLPKSSWLIDTTTVTNHYVKNAAAGTDGWSSYTIS